MISKLYSGNIHGESINIAAVAAGVIVTFISMLLLLGAAILVWIVITIKKTHKQPKWDEGKLSATLSELLNFSK